MLEFVAGEETTTVGAAFAVTIASPPPVLLLEQAGKSAEKARQVVMIECKECRMSLGA